MSFLIFFVSRFCLINAGVAYIYFSSFQKVDEDEFGGPWELTKEGFMTSFAVFFVSLVYCLLICTRGKFRGGPTGSQPLPFYIIIF